jgi:sortase A
MFRINLNNYQKKVMSQQLINLAEAQEITRVQQEADSWKVNSYFSIVIPKIAASANITANVDPSIKEEYLQSLKKGVAHAKGTYFPGQGENIFLFSHSTDSALNIARYNAVFYLLRKLEEGDKIIIFFADKRFEYEVAAKFTAESSDTSWLTEESDGEKLLLMTCDPPGTTWRRLIVSAKLINQ